MNKIVLQAALSMIGLTASAAAQQPTLSATVTEDLSVLAEDWCLWCFDYSSLPVGPLPAGGVNLSASTSGSTAQMGAAELTGLRVGPVTLDRAARPENADVHQK